FPRASARRRQALFPLAQHDADARMDASIRALEGQDQARPLRRQYSILDSQPRVRLFSLEYAQLLTEGKDLEAEVVARTEECAEAGDEGDKKWNHEFGFIA